MILNRLYELAVRDGLLADPAFEELAVPFVVHLGEGGTFLNIDGERPRPPKKGEARVERKLSVPRPHGNTASQGFARYFADTVARVLPVVFDEKNREKEARSRATFWAQIDGAADATDDPGLRAVQAFGRRLTDGPLAEDVGKAVAARDATGADRVTFAYFPDGGPTVLERPGVRQWYAKFFRQFTDAKQTDGPVGFCTITGTVGPLPTSHALSLSGVPGGLPTGVKIVSFDKPAFQHYGLDGAANAAVGYEAADGYARAFQRLRGRREHHFVVGGTLLLFWTREPADLDDINALGQADPDQVKKLLGGVGTGKEVDAVSDANDFYLLAVSGNSARAVVRDYLERPLGRVRASIRKWFADLSITDLTIRGGSNSAFPLKWLAAATVRWRHTGGRSEADWDAVADAAPGVLMRAAVGGGPAPDGLLAACLQRLEAEGWRGFRAPRMALMKLTLIRREVAMSSNLDDGDERPPYLYGRLLALFERIQYKALGEVNSNVVDKFYATFSTNPLSILEGLQRLARAHFKKMRTDATKRGSGLYLERELTRLSERIRASEGLGRPRPPFTRYERAVFSFGYYHQKARYIFPPEGTDSAGAGATDPIATQTQE